MALDISTQLSGFSSSFSPRSAARLSSPAVSSALPAESAGDTVKLSEAAQAQSLHQQGESVGNIADSLGTDLATVDDYLGVTVELSAPGAGGSRGGSKAESPATAPVRASGSTSEPVAAGPKAPAPAAPGQTGQSKTPAPAFAVQATKSGTLVPLSGQAK